jgi:2-polyprenyl-3-methyl-5-hydroxy-6-metoxy-1,4-benzoquinol methylase
MEQRMSRLTREIQEHYFQGHEQERLSSNEGELERLRTQAILSRFLPTPPAVLLDVGGGAGIHAFELAERGYVVHLIDPMAALKQTRAHSDKAGGQIGLNQTWRCL